MANLTIDTAEILFLQEVIIRNYCTRTRQDYRVFRGKLTGTMKYYIDIAENINGHLDTELLRTYAGQIGEGPFRTALLKFLENEARPGRSRESQWRPTVTENAMRKLLFNDFLKYPDLTFKDFFVVAFYAYVGLDRAEVLEKVTTDGVGSAGGSSSSAEGTLRPEAYRSGNLPAADGGTIDPFHKRIQCMLRPLDADGKAGEAIAFIYNDGPIVLNRSNLDPQNNTITSKKQATLNWVDGRWVLENSSELKTTFIKVIKPVSIEKGDIIVFGNKHFLVG